MSSNLPSQKTKESKNAALKYLFYSLGGGFLGLIAVVAGIVTTVIVLRTRKKKNTEAVTSTLEKNDTKS